MSARKAQRPAATRRSAAKPRALAKPRTATIDEYLAALAPTQRAALERLRRTIRRIVPRAEECISYGIPAFRFEGRMLVGFGARAGHCSFYPWSGSTVRKHRADLAGYDTSPGTIRFRADEPLPPALVLKLVRSRIAENAAKRERATGRVRSAR